MRKLIASLLVFTIGVGANGLYCKAETGTQVAQSTTMTDENAAKKVEKGNTADKGSDKKRKTEKRERLKRIFENLFSAINRFWWARSCYKYFWSPIIMLGTFLLGEFRKSLIMDGFVKVGEASYLLGKFAYEATAIISCGKIVFSGLVDLLLALLGVCILIKT